MLKTNNHYRLRLRPAEYAFTAPVESMVREGSMMSDYTAKSMDSYTSPTMRYSWTKTPMMQDSSPESNMAAPMFPPLYSQSSLSKTSPEVTTPSTVNKYQHWKQNNKWAVRRHSFWLQDAGAQESPRTTFQMTFTPRDLVKVDIYHRQRPRPLPRGNTILPDEPDECGPRLLPSVDRAKMVELPSKLGGPKKLVESPTKASGVFYSEHESRMSQEEPKYWNSLTSLNGKEFSRKKELFPRPTQLTVHYFNGGAPASPLRKNRRTMFPLKRSDSSRVDFNSSLYGPDKDDTASKNSD